MKNLVITSRDGIMCKIGEKPPSKTMDVFKSVIITERFDGEKHSLCLSVADGDLIGILFYSPTESNFYLPSVNYWNISIPNNVIFR